MRPRNISSKGFNADPSFLHAYIGPADAYDGRLLPSLESAAIAENARKKIMELAPNSPIAALVSGRTKRDDCDWTGATDTKNP